MEELAHCQGQHAQASGVPRDACPYLKPGRANAWLRGWLHNAELIARHAAPSPTLSDEGRAALANIKRILEQ